MSIYLGKQEVGITLLNDTEPIGLDEILNHTFTSGDVVYTGTRIWPYSFSRMTEITSFTAPNLTKITNNANASTNGVGTAAFEGCSNLISIDMPELINIGTGGYQFYGCSKLVDVNLPKVIGNTSGGYTFGSCSSLEHIFLPKASP